MEEITGELLASLDKRVEDLRNWYEQYFMGQRKRAPEQERTSVTFLVRRLANQTINNYQLRFQFQQITAKYNSYNQYWNRIIQQIEAGTYYRDRYKAKLHEQEAEAPPPPSPGAAPKPKPPGGETKMDQLYQELMEARKQTNQTGNISKEKMAESINKQLPALQEKYKGKQVEFKVVVENGQAKLKATLK